MNNYHCMKELTKEILEAIKNDKIDWLTISNEFKLTEDFIRQYQDKIDWYQISCYQKLSEEFIREFKDKVYWDYISLTQILSEDFIRQFQDKVNWFNLSGFQYSTYFDFYNLFIDHTFSDSFIEDFNNKLDFDSMLHAHKLNGKMLKKHILKIDPYKLCAYNKLNRYSKQTQKFILENTIQIAGDYYDNMTPYMKKYYEKLRMML